MRAVGLKVSKGIISHDRRFTYVLITASDEVLEKEAERMGLGIRLVRRNDKDVWVLIFFFFCWEGRWQGAKEDLL